MKLFLVLLLAATCQAFSIKSMIEEEAFNILISEATEELERLAIQQFEKAVLSDNKEMNTFERELINKFAAYFGSSLRKEVDIIFKNVRDVTDAKTAFAQKMYENLRQAAVNISKGAHMAPKAAAKFLHDMMYDIEAMEKSGIFSMDIETMFKDVMQRISRGFTYDLIEKRGLIDVLGKINDTLLKIIGHLHGKFHDLHDFLKTIVKSAGEKLQPHLTNIKTLAKDFVSHINGVSASVAKEALAFFKPFASSLGDTWFKLVQKIHDRLQEISNHANATPIY